MAHHSCAAEFDASKRVSLEGVVTTIEWSNPHVWFYINVKDDQTGEVTRPDETLDAVSSQGNNP